MKVCGFDIGLEHFFFLIVGHFVIELHEMAFDSAGRLQEITGKLGIPFIYKSSFDKTNFPECEVKLVFSAGGAQFAQDGRRRGPTRAD